MNDQELEALLSEIESDRVERKSAGSHLAAVQSVYKDFRQLARDIAKKIGLTLP